jgi:hypothetical protein
LRPDKPYVGKKLPSKSEAGQLMRGRDLELDRQAARSPLAGFGQEGQSRGIKQAAGETLLDFLAECSRGTFSREQEMHGLSSSATVLRWPPH